MAGKPPSATVPDNLIPVPFVNQKRSYSCGPAATLAILRYWNYARYRQVSERSLYDDLGTKRSYGTDPQPMADRLNDEESLTATYVYDTRTRSVTIADLEAAIDRGEPPIVDLQAWQDVDEGESASPWSSDWDDGHFAILVGYDDENLYFMDPSTEKRYAFIPRSEFESRWHDVDGKLRRSHMVIFVRGTSTPYRPPSKSPLPKDASYME